MPDDERTTAAGDEEKKVTFTPRPGHPGQTMLTEFICPDGHTVIEWNSPEKEYFSKTPDPDETVRCDECEIEYQMHMERTMIPKVTPDE